MARVTGPGSGKLLLSHPHAAAVASGLAYGLAGQQRLSAYYTGVSAAHGTAAGRALRLLAGRWPTLSNRVHDGRLRTELHPMPAVELVARALGGTCRVWPGRVQAYDCLFALHDYAVSRASWTRDTAAVYAYEDGARASFQRAARSGRARIWDLPTPHHRFVAALWAQEQRQWPDLASARGPEPEWKLARKDAELGLASAVCVASRFTASSLPDRATGEPVFVIPYGFPIKAFAAKDTPGVGPLVVLSVGTQSVQKGTHYLLRAWKQAGLKDARLRLIGPLRLSRRFLAEFEGLFEHVAHMPRGHLAAEYRAADILAFPTLADGFGLVIQEAMCSGPPVLTTPGGSGPECITSGEDGWVVPPRDVDALVDALRSAAGNRDRVFRMGQAARRRAEGWTWDDVGRKLVAELTAHALL